VRCVLQVALAVAACGCVLFVGSDASPAKAPTAAPGPKADQTIRNIRALQIALQSYCVYHGDRWPRSTSDCRFRAQLRPYMDRWPVNPWSHRPMRQKRNRGNFSYRRLGDSYRLIGWGPHDRRIVVAP
jgi:hypothetical protein